jgi:hypothetical protein
MRSRTILIGTGIVVLLVFLHFSLGGSNTRAVHQSNPAAPRPLPAQAATVMAPPGSKMKAKQKAPTPVATPVRVSGKTVAPEPSVSATPISDAAVDTSKLAANTKKFLATFYRFPEGDVEELHCAAINKEISRSSEAVKADVCFQTDTTRALLYSNSSTVTMTATGTLQKDRMRIKRVDPHTFSVSVPVVVTISSNGSTSRTLTKQTTSTWRSDNGRWVLITYREA